MSILDEDPSLFIKSPGVDNSLYNSLKDFGVVHMVACVLDCSSCIGAKYNINRHGCPACASREVMRAPRDGFIVKCPACGAQISTCGAGDVDGVAVVPWAERPLTDDVI